MFMLVCKTIMIDLFTTRHLNTLGRGKHGHHLEFEV